MHYRACMSLTIFTFFCNITSYKIIYIRRYYIYNNIATSEDITFSHFISETQFSLLKWSSPLPNLHIKMKWINCFYDPHCDIKKNFKGYRRFEKGIFEFEKHNFILYVASNTGKTSSIKNYCSLYETIHVFYEEDAEWQG